VAVNVEPVVDLDIDLDPASRCKVDDRVDDYVAVDDNVEGQTSSSRSRSTYGCRERVCDRPTSRPTNRSMR
jgi:hypothetical protein